MRSSIWDAIQGAEPKILIGTGFLTIVVKKKKTTYRPSAVAPKRG